MCFIIAYHNMCKHITKSTKYHYVAITNLNNNHMEPCIDLC